MFTDDNECCDCQLSEAHYNVAQAVANKIQTEQLSKKTLSLYQQLKLQSQLQQDTSLDPNIRKDILYTNREMIRDIGREIIKNNINLPASYQKLTNDDNTNIILNSIQNRAQHIQKNPYGAR